jgi:hypothetical protein
VGRKARSSGYLPMEYAPLRRKGKGGEVPQLHRPLSSLDRASGLIGHWPKNEDRTAPAGPAVRGLRCDTRARRVSLAGLGIYNEVWRSPNWPKLLGPARKSDYR